MTAATRDKLFWFGLVLASAVGVFLKSAKAIDFLDYYVSVRHYFGGVTPMYGPTSGTAFAGGIYRYPPVCLFLMRPLVWLPFRWSAALWAAAKGVLAGLLLVGLRRRWGLQSWLPLLPGVLLVTPYAIQELRYGNVQFYILALTVWAFLLADDHPLGGGLALGLAAALKLWPLFFFPCILVQRRWRYAAGALAGLTVFSLLPVLFVGWPQLLVLFKTWIAQERTLSHLSASAGELWFPGQSLHDVMRRYLGVVDYTRLVDTNYPQVAWLHLAPTTIERLWMALAAAITLSLFAYLYRERDGDAAIGVMFCALCVLEPNIHRLIYEALLWPAAWASVRVWRTPRRLWPKALFYCAAVVAVAQPLLPGSARQRLLQVYGVDFWLVLLPLLAAVVALAAADRRCHLPVPNPLGAAT